MRAGVGVPGLGVGLAVEAAVRAGGCESENAGYLTRLRRWL